MGKPMTNRTGLTSIYTRISRKQRPMTKTNINSESKLCKEVFRRNCSNHIKGISILAVLLSVRNGILEMYIAHLAHIFIGHRVSKIHILGIFACVRYFEFIVRYAVLVN